MPEAGRGVCEELPTTLCREITGARVAATSNGLLEAGTGTLTGFNQLKTFRNAGYYVLHLAAF